MTVVQVYDPPMCCSTGVCGPTVDPKLVRFAGDLHWLVNHGVRIERYNLAQEPHAFATSAVVRAALETEGNACLPLLMVNGEVRSKGDYPGRRKLAQLAGLLDEFDAEASSGSPSMSLPVIQR